MSTPHAPGESMPPAAHSSDPPLAGLVVLEAATVIAGPMTTMILGDYGARVIKVEHPHGETMRHQSKGLWKYFARNKECVTCNLSSPEGAELFVKLAARADVVVENFRPGTFARWGLDYERLSADNPGLILLHLSGFGQDGPYIDRPGYGSLVEAMSGLTGVTGEADGPPTPPGQPVADPMAAMSAVSAILMALRSRERTGLGQEIDLSLYGPMLYLMGMSVADFNATGRSPVRGGYFSERNMRCIGQCADGSWALAVAIDAKRLQLIDSFLLDRGYFPDDDPERDRNVTEIGNALRDWLARTVREQALSELVAADIPCAPINSVEDVTRQDLFLARGDFVEYPDGEGATVRMPRPALRFSRSDVRIGFAGEPLGARNAQIYGDWLGVGAERLQALRESGAI